jgi:hypothetical protein
MAIGPAGSGCEWGCCLACAPLPLRGDIYCVSCAKHCVPVRQRCVQVFGHRCVRESLCSQTHSLPASFWTPAWRGGAVCVWLLVP